MSFDETVCAASEIVGFDVFDELLLDMISAPVGVEYLRMDKGNMSCSELLQPCNLSNSSSKTGGWTSSLPHHIVRRVSPGHLEQERCTSGIPNMVDQCSRVQF